MVTVDSSSSASDTGLAPGGPSAHPGSEDLDKLLREAFERLGMHALGLYLLSENRQILELAIYRGLPAEFIGPWLKVGLTSPLPVTDAVRENRVVWVGSEEDMVRRYPRLAVALPYAFSLAASPITFQGRTLGAFFAHWPGSHPADLPAEERQELTALAGRLADFMERSASEGHPLQAHSRLPMVGPRERMDPAEVLTALVRRLPEGVCAMDLSGRLTAVNPRAAELLGEPVERLLDARPWRVLSWLNDPVYEDRYRAAVFSQQPTSFTALRPPSHWLSFELYPDTSGLTVRISPTDATQPEEPAEERVVGYPDPARAGALYHILHLASALTEAVGVQDVVSMIADQIVPAFGGQAVAILVVEGGRLRLIGQRGYPPDLLELLDRTPLTAMPLGVQVPASPVPAFFESPEALDPVYPGRLKSGDGMAAWAYLPLVVSGRLIGTCTLAFDRPHRFGAHERGVLTALAGLIAQALDRARLYDTKLEVAHGLQESLLPQALPRVPGLQSTARYLAGTEGMDIGGDFYDIIPIDRDTAGIVIGDVQGHNVDAAALMGQIRIAVRAFATENADPGMVLARTNRLLTRLDTTLLASCAYLRIDLAARQARLATAGHPAPLLRTPDGSVHALESAGGMLLNVQCAVEYPVARVELPVGTTVALFTDGLYETPGVDLDESLAELGTTLARYGGGPLDALADALTGRAVHAVHRTDDIALLLVRSTSR